MSYLLPDSAQAIRDYYHASDWEELYDLISPETAALMFFRLRKAPDDIFPHGKWATIQRLEGLIEELKELRPEQPVVDSKVFNQAHGLRENR